jgi:DNA polymerase III subunit gamma/tau
MDARRRSPLQFPHHSRLATAVLAALGFAFAAVATSAPVANAQAAGVATEATAAAEALVEPVASAGQAPSPSSTEAAAEATPPPAPTPSPPPVSAPAPDPAPVPGSSSRPSLPDIRSTVGHSASAVKTGTADIERVVDSTPGAGVSGQAGEIVQRAGKTAETAFDETVKKSEDVNAKAATKITGGKPSDDLLSRPLHRVAEVTGSVAGAATRTVDSGIVLPNPPGDPEIPAAGEAAIGAEPLPVSTFEESGLTAPREPSGRPAHPPAPRVGDAPTFRAGTRPRASAGTPPARGSVVTPAAAGPLGSTPERGSRAPAVPSLPMPHIPPVLSSASTDGFDSSLLLAAVPALLALLLSVTAFRRRTAAGSYRPALFVCVLERPG